MRRVRSLLRQELLALRSHRACDTVNARMQAANRCELNGVNSRSSRPLTRSLLANLLNSGSARERS